MLECSLYKPIREKLPLLSESVVLGSLKPFFPLDHKVDISLYRTEATTHRHSRKSATVKPS